MCLSSVLAASGSFPANRFDYVQRSTWQLTRDAALVVLGTVTSVDDEVSLQVTEVLKGEATVREVRYPRPPPPPATPTRICPPPREYSFLPGHSWLVFLTKSESALQLELAICGDNAAVLEDVRACLEFDAMPEGRERCAFLVNRVLACCGASSGPALLELRTKKYNAPDSLDLLAPLATSAHATGWYVQLLGANDSPRATEILRGYLATDDLGMLLAVIEALRRKDVNDPELSRNLLALLPHPDARVRRAVIYVLRYRSFHEAASRIIEHLGDPDFTVREMALAWPWRVWVKQHPEVLPQIRRRLHDPESAVRSAAGGALTDLRDVRSFYRLWVMSLLDTRRVRKNVHLGLLVERSPAAAALLLWPTALALVISRVAQLRMGRRRWLRTGILGWIAGALLGAGIGYLVGSYWSGNPFLQALILMPSIFAPLGIAVATVGVAWQRRAATVGNRPVS